MKKEINHYNHLYDLREYSVNYRSTRTMKQETINYADLINLGFNRVDLQDSIYFNQHGYESFIVQLETEIGVTFVWKPDERTCEAQRIDEEGNITRRMPVKDLDHLKILIKFFTKGK